MLFDRPQTVSFKPAGDGDYVGVLVGFCFVGMHDTADWGPKPKCMLRWELHNLESPHDLCVDDEDLTHVVTQSFPATIRGESSWLYKCLVAHGIAVPGGTCADSKHWYGRVARLSVESVQGKRGDRFFSNVVAINPIGQEVNIKPTLNFEHWEPSDEAPPPSWAKFMIERSSDLYQRAMTSVKPGQPAQRETAVERHETPYQPPSNPSSGYQAPRSGYQAPEMSEDEIPF